MRSAVVLALCLSVGCRLGFGTSASSGDGGVDGAADGDAMLDGGDASVPIAPIVAIPPTCANGVKDGLETGVDCGGVCERCDHCTTQTVAGSSCYCNVEWLTTADTPVEFTAAYAVSSNAAILAGDGGHILWWDGTRFEHGFVGAGNYEAASGTGEGDIWVAGDQVWHWDGTAWTRASVPGTVFVKALHARTPTDVWGVSSQGAIFHYDGTAWTATQAYPMTTFLTVVHALSSTDVLVGALDGTFEHWNGSTRTPVSGAAFNRIAAIAGVSATEVYLLASTTTSSTSVWRWNGTSFTDLLPNVLNPESIASDTPGTVWVSGGNEVAYYDGSTWTHYPMPAGFGGSSSPSSAGGMELAAAGGRVFVADDRKRMTFDRTTWTTSGTTAEDIRGVWGSGTQFHAITTKTWFHDGSGGAAIVREASPSTTSSLWAVSASDVWSMTSLGAAYHYDGTSWTNQGAASGFAAGSSTSDVWGVSQASAGTARHWTGAAFADTTLPANFTAQDAWAVSPTLAYAAGKLTSTSAPALAMWNGSIWAPVTAPPSTGNLTGVWATSASDVWVLSYGATANIWHWNGSAWADSSTGSGVAYASALRGGGAGIYVLAQGRLNHWNGSSWTLVSGQNGSCPYTSSAVLWVTPTEVWIGGAYGMFGRYTP